MSGERGERCATCAGRITLNPGPTARPWLHVDSWIDFLHEATSARLADLNARLAAGERYCEPCGDAVPVMEESVETAQWPQPERDYWVTRLDCGHEIVAEAKR